MASSLQALGAETLLLPLLEIVPFNDKPSLRRLAQLSGYDLLIFVSANAVEFSLPHFMFATKKPQIAAIGSATASKCIEHGINVDFVPEQADSEGLLDMPRFQQIQDQRVLIVRGQGGRAYLGAQLQQRGAQVEYAEVYQRQIPKVTLSAEQSRVNVIMITSSEALTHLVELAQHNQQDWVFGKQLCLIHERIAGRARELGFTLNPLVAEQANDAGMVSILVTWAQTAKESKSE
jgi:uroporphyrinogen-III synthase